MLVFFIKHVAYCSANHLFGLQTYFTKKILSFFLSFVFAIKMLPTFRVYTGKWKEKTF